MKKLLVSFIFCICLLLSPSGSWAHPGRTDSQGGHYDLSTGEYHYHHGYPAHQHPNGVCPYGNKDQTKHQTRISRVAANTAAAPVSTSKKAEETQGTQNSGAMIAGSALGGAFLYGLVSHYFKKKR